MEFDNNFDNAQPPNPISNSIADPGERSVVPIREMTEEETYLMTQSVRRAMVMHLTSSGLPNDSESVSSLLGVLDSMDKQMINKRKMQLEEEVADSTIEAKRMIAALLTDAETPDLLATRNTRAEPVDVEFEIVTPEGFDTIVEAVPGQLEVNPDQLDYSTLMESGSEE